MFDLLKQKLGGFRLHFPHRVPVLPGFWKKTCYSKLEVHTQLMLIPSLKLYEAKNEASGIQIMEIFPLIKPSPNLKKSTFFPETSAFHKVFFTEDKLIL